MRKQTRPAVGAVPAAVGTSVASIENLVARSGGLKGELVAFAQSPRFSKQLTARLRSAAGRRGSLDEGTAVLTIDHFALQHRLPDWPQIAQIILQTVTTHPELLRRNPDKLRRAWQMQAEDRAEFIALFGSDLVVLPPDEAQEKLREHRRRRRAKAVANLTGKAAERAKATGPTPEEMSRLPEELLEADSVALVYDEVEGLNYYRDFGRMDALFADPSLVRDRTYITQLREYLQDESVSPMAIRRLVERHPEGANPVFRDLLRKPGFSWERDGEELLRRRKKNFFDREPTPSISPVGDRLAELLRTGQ